MRINRRTIMRSAAAASLAVLPGGHALAQTDDGTAMSTPDAETLRLAKSIIPGNRILAYYGFPGNAAMGILGAYGKDELRAKIVDQASAYEKADPYRPVKLAFEILASVAQADPGADETYLAYTDDSIIKEYVDYTQAHGILLILDMQYGLQSTKDQMDVVEKWLEYDHVHLALDPEFAIQPGEVPGQDYGTLAASEVTYAQNRLAALAKKQNIGPKVLVVHQVKWFELPDKDKITAVDGVDFVLDVDGWGPPSDKLDTYGVLAGPPLIQYYGFKLWYDQDVPLMTPDAVLGLDPSPDVIIYQ